MNRRTFLKSLGAIASFPLDLEAKLTLSSPDYHDISHSEINWKEIEKGLSFSRVGIYRQGKLVDILSAIKINPTYNAINVFNSYMEGKGSSLLTIEGWQEVTGAHALVNSAQYLGDPTWGKPCALVISNGRHIGSTKNKTVRGMLVAEPTDESLPLADLLDFKYDSFDPQTTPYTEGVQHWPILLNREKQIRVNKTDWQANRTVLAKDHEKNIVFFTTEGGFFTLYNFGRFLRDEGSDYNIHTAMNSDGGYEAEMCIKTPDFNYVTYGQFETQGPENDISIPNTRAVIPAAIGVFPRNS